MPFELEYAAAHIPGASGVDAAAVLNTVKASRKIKGREQSGQLRVGMTTDDFIARNAKAITTLWQSVERNYGVTERQFADRLAQIAARAGHFSTEKKSGKEIFAAIRAQELCLAIACEQGSDEAWQFFETEYRHLMNGAARSLTKDEVEAEDLAQFVFGELYGLRFDGDRRMSKLSHYSGRGSLGGWLRAVVYQCFIDRKRQTARFEQVEEVEEFDRLALASAAYTNSKPAASLSRPDNIEDVRLRRATEEAMTKAFAEIDVKDQLLLNYYYFDDLTLREIGLLMKVHEATICRWLAKSQREVKRKTEEILQRSYGLRRAEVAECLEIAARTELDVRKLLTNAKRA